MPFSDMKDFEEQKKVLLAPMKDLKIMADAAHVAWDMERFQFLDQVEEFDPRLTSGRLIPGMPVWRAVTRAGNVSTHRLATAAFKSLFLRWS